MDGGMDGGMDGRMGGGMDGRMGGGMDGGLDGTKKNGNGRWTGWSRNLDGMVTESGRQAVKNERFTVFLSFSRFLG